MDVGIAQLRLDILFRPKLPIDRGYRDAVYQAVIGGVTISRPQPRGAVPDAVVSHMFLCRQKESDSFEIAPRQAMLFEQTERAGYRGLRRAHGVEPLGVDFHHLWNHQRRQQALIVNSSRNGFFKFSATV